MSIFRTPYDTTVGSHIVTQEIEKDIILGLVADNLSQNQIGIRDVDGIRSIGIMGSCPSATKIPFFTSPLLIKDSHRKQYLAMDYRPFTTILDKNKCDFGSVRIKNLTDFNLALYRQTLALAWITGRQVDIKNTCRYAGYLFAIWISQALAQRYALDPAEQFTIQAITDFYYQTLFIDQSTFSDEEKRRFAAHTIKATRAPLNTVVDIFDKIEEMSNLESLCRNISKIVDNVRLEGLSAGILISLMGNSWYGLDAAQIISIALEYPPTWISLVYIAMSEKTFKHTKIANLADRFKMSGESSTFVLNTSKFVKEYMDFTSQNSSLEELDPHELKPLIIDGQPIVLEPGLSKADNEPQVDKAQPEPHTELLDDPAADDQKKEGVVEPNIAEVIHSQPHVQHDEWVQTSKPVMDPIVDEEGGLPKDSTENNPEGSKFKKDLINVFDKMVKE